MTTQERINSTKTNVEQDTARLADLRTERARLTLDGKEVTDVDEEISRLLKNIDNAPAELRLLEEKLAKEQQRLAEEKQNQLIEQQKKIAEDVETLSKKFIALLEKAVTINESLIAAINAEANIRAKTGKQFLSEYCDGSLKSLQALLDKSQQEMTGSHGTVHGQPVKIML